MKVIIIEDEIIAYRNLVRLIENYDSSILIEEPLPTVERAIKRLSDQNPPDLIFMDVQLADGLCFEILNSINLETPVIFTTAYNEYAIKAFQTYCVDYLLKPIGPETFTNSMEKFFRYYYKKENPDTSNQLNKLIQDYYTSLSPQKLRFLVKSGKKYKSIPIEDIAYFYKEDITWVYCWNGQRYLLDESLSELEKKLPQENFFRLNRQFIAHIKSIIELLTYSRSRLKVKLEPSPPPEIFVSQATANSLKKWLNL